MGLEARDGVAEAAGAELGSVVGGDLLEFQVATVSKKWLRVRDTYGVEIAEGEDDVLILAAAIAIERLTDRRRDDD